VKESLLSVIECTWGEWCLARASSEIHKLTNADCNKEQLSQHWKESVNVVLMVRLTKLTVVNANFIHHTSVKVKVLYRWNYGRSSSWVST